MLSRATENSVLSIQSRLRELGQKVHSPEPRVLAPSDPRTLREAAELLDELKELRTQLALTTEPKPISELHEDHGCVLAARYDGDTIDDIRVVHLLDDDFDGEWWTHFYHLPRIQPPKE